MTDNNALQQSIRRIAATARALRQQLRYDWFVLLVVVAPLAHLMGVY